MTLDIFVHVPRTAGTTLTQVFRERYPSRRTLLFDDPDRAEEAIPALPQERRDEVELVAGHVRFGVHRHFRQPARYATMLRHPAARIASHYRYARSNPGHYLHEEVVARDLDLAGYARGELSDELRNGQVRMFAADGSLEEAKRVLAEEMAVVGLTERFDESLLLMQDALGWSTPYYTPENRTARSAEPLTSGEVAAIEAASPLDFELYAFAEELLSQRIEAQPAFADRLRRFRRRNRVLAPATKPVRAWRLAR